MRFVPLIPSDLDPAPWRRQPAVELAWTGQLHPSWGQAGPELHAIHLPAQPWTGALGDTVLAVLRPRLELDFLVIPAACPRDRLASSSFMAVLEGLLEVTQGTGVKLALLPGPGEAKGLVKLLKAARGEAVGFCWNSALNPDLDCISDRLFCAVGTPSEDFADLQRLGYRWNLALPGQEPGPFQATRTRLEQAFPAVLFPAGLAPQAPSQSVPEPS